MRLAHFAGPIGLAEVECPNEPGRMDLLFWIAIPFLVMFAVTWFPFRSFVRRNTA